jgi:hypothetical protein
LNNQWYTLGYTEKGADTWNQPIIKRRKKGRKEYKKRKRKRKREDTCTIADEQPSTLVSHLSSEKTKPKPLYVCPGCSNHTYSNNMVNIYNISINYRVKSYKMTRGSKRRITE